METYKKAPKIITGKDLDYLSDMFKWNLGALKTTINHRECIQDKKIQNIFEDAIQLFENNIKVTFDILGGINNE